MEPRNQLNHIKVQTNELSDKMTPIEANRAIHSCTLYYKKDKFLCQGFFTQPLVGRLNTLENLEKNADVYFRSVRMIGTNLFHITLAGPENQVRKMCDDVRFYKLLQEIGDSLDQNHRMRPYVDIVGNRKYWDAIVSMDQKTFYLANRVMVDGEEIRIHNIIIVGDRMIGLTDDNEAVMGQMIPDVMENPGMMLDMEKMGEVNWMGTIDLLAPVPNSEDLFLVTVGNTIYQFNIWGDMTHFEELEEDINQVNSINFNQTSSIVATNNGLYEIDVQEMPNMVRATSLPRRIAGNHLSDEFKEALYTEDPYVLGIHPAIGIFSKNKDEDVFFF